MGLSYISKANEEEEKKSLHAIFQSIDKNESILFNSGAGAGKTYALIESLRYVIRKYGKILRSHNQKIICITYTNVATEEIKERLGNSDLVLVSTIHERIWHLIKDYKKELVKIHQEKLQESTSDLEKILDKEYIEYSNLTVGEKENFKNLMLGNKELFYLNYDLNAKDFKNIFQNILTEFPTILKNNAKFKKIVSTLFKIENYIICQENINLKRKGFNTVVYNSMYNADQLHKMRISHNTLLEYGLRIIEEHDVLKQIIIDKYPYFFIDEYQDTDLRVVTIMNSLSNYSKKIIHSLFIGFFGDTTQNIYNTGVGKSLTKIHSDLILINKQFNRRSTKEVIDVINRIRNDDIQQTSIYEDCEGGSVKFYLGNKHDINNFISTYEYQWGINLENQLHCLVLTNEIVAIHSGFMNIYRIIKSTGRYSGKNYEQLNTELLSNDLLKLGEVQRLLFKVVQLKFNLSRPATQITEILHNDIYEDMNIIDLRELINSLKRNEGETLGEYIKSLSINYHLDQDERYKKVIDSIFDFGNISIDLFKNFLLEKLFPNISDDTIVKSNEIIQELLEVNMYEFELWYKFIISKEDESIIYHTFHGTKGLEFDNVIIIMEDSFGKSNDYFKFFFENYNNTQNLDDSDKQKFEQIQNLLYVSCSRAKINLRILYLNSTIDDFSDNIKSIFGEISKLEQPYVDTF